MRAHLLGRDSSKMLTAAGGPMRNTFRMRPFVHAAFLFVAFAPVALPLIAQKQLPLNQGTPGVQVNHRLILKDGTYQVVRKYEVVGDRVRYISVERGGDWEELPASLVDWDATKKWETEHSTAATEDASPAMKEAESIDKEESAEREEEKNRMPIVAP